MGDSCRRMSGDAHLSLIICGGPRCLGASVAEPAVNLMTKFTSARPPALRGGESRPGPRPLLPHSSPAPLSGAVSFLCAHVASRRPLFPFLYLLRLSLPHSWKPEGVVQLPWQPPTPTPFSVPPQFFCILIRSLFIVQKASSPSSVVLQRRLPVCREC